jgi:hypothetical protein
VESEDVFFEIKRKYQGYRTDKFRKNVSDLLYELGTDEYKEIKARYNKHDVDSLKVTLNNFFHRMTLVSKKMTERVTIDFHIKFSKEDKEVGVNDIAIIEVKQGKYDEMSPIIQLLKRERIYPANISKYTYGLLLLETGIKYNAFKKLLHNLNKIQSINGINRQSC